MSIIEGETLCQNLIAWSRTHQNQIERVVSVLIRVIRGTVVVQFEIWATICRRLVASGRILVADRYHARAVRKQPYPSCTVYTHSISSNHLWRIAPSPHECLCIYVHVASYKCILKKIWTASEMRQRCTPSHLDRLDFLFFIQLSTFLHRNQNYPQT